MKGEVNLLKKFCCMVLIVCLAIGAFAGCGKEKVADGEEQVTLKWLIGGPGKLEDSEMVWAKFNEELKKYLPNTTVEFTVIPHSDYAEKWRLMSAAQEPMDIVWVSYALNFVDEVGKGSYMDLTELADKYGQEMKSEFPDWLLELTTVNDKIYAVPNYQMMAMPVGFSIDKTHVDKNWIDINKASEMFLSKKVLHKDDYKIFENYFQKVLESNEKVKYVSSSFLSRAVKDMIGMPSGGIETIIANACIKNDEDGFKVYDKLVDFPDNYEYYDLMNEWYKKGYIRKDILANSSEKEGDYLLWWTSVFKGTKERLAIKYGKPMEIINLYDLPVIGYKGSTTNTAIAANCKHPERAMKLINLMNSKRGADLLNLLSYGIEGRHYEKISNGRIKWLEPEIPGSSNNRYGYDNWVIGNTINSYTTQSDPEGWNEYINNEINMKAKMSRLAGFTLDTKPIKMELSQYEAKLKEYAYLDKGTTPNYKEVLEERNRKLKEAGSEKIVQEVQRQIDEWAKNRK